MRHFPIYLFLIALFVVSCGKDKEEVVVDEETNEIKNDSGYMRIAVTPTIDCLPLYVAYEEGMIENAGLKVSFHRFNAHMDVDTALVGGSVDGAFTDIIRAEYLQGKYKVYLSYETTTELQWQLITNKKARLNRLDQFGDKMIATTRFSGTDYFTDKAFTGVKVTAPYFKIQINDVNLRLKMLLNNELDALWLPEPQASLAVAAGNKSLLNSDKYNERMGVLAFRSKYVKTKGNLKLLDQLDAVYNQACDSINKKGYNAYLPVFQKYYDMDGTAVSKLSKGHFSHVHQPGTDLVGVAKKYIGK